MLLSKVASVLPSTPTSESRRSTPTSDGRRPRSRSGMTNWCGRAVDASEAYVAKKLDQNALSGKGSDEQIMKTWYATMYTDIRLPYERCVVLTTAALYRCQFLPEHGFVNKCRRTPLRDVHCVYIEEQSQLLVVQERIPRDSPLASLKDLLLAYDSEPPNARPWRKKTHSLQTRWYAAHEPGQLEEMERAINRVATWSLPRPGTKGSETDSLGESVDEGYGSGLGSREEYSASEFVLDGSQHVPPDSEAASTPGRWRARPLEGPGLVVGDLVASSPDLHSPGRLKVGLGARISTEMASSPDMVCDFMVDESRWSDHAEEDAQPGTFTLAGKTLRRGTHRSHDLTLVDMTEENLECFSSAH